MPNSLVTLTGAAAKHRPCCDVRAAPNDETANKMRAIVLSEQADSAWEAGPRSAAELKKAAAELQRAAVHFDRAAALCNAPAQKAILSADADVCRSLAPLAASD